MARSSLTTIEQDVLDDSGSVLWSFIKGEQLEYPVTLSFLDNATAGYNYEAVVVEGLNVAEQTSPPNTHKPAGVQTVLTVRVPTNRGTWNAATGYNTEDLVTYGGNVYRLVSGTGYVNATPPGTDPNWILSALNKIYIQFPNTLASTWAVQPIVNGPTYGFFELRVSEASGTFPRTWKPVRGMVQILFSPTDIVP